MDNKECLELLVNFYMGLAKSLNMVDPNGSMYGTLLNKRRETVSKLNKLIETTSKELDIVRDKLDEATTKTFKSLQAQSKALKAKLNKAIALKTKIESTFSSLTINASNSNKFLNYTWSTTDRGSGIKKGTRKSGDPQVQLRDLLLTILDIVDDVAVENDTNFLAQCQYIDAKEIAWAFASALDYHCHQKASDAGLKAKLNMSTKEVYAMYKKPIEMLFKVCNSYDKPIED